MEVAAKEVAARGVAAKGVATKGMAAEGPRESVAVVEWAIPGKVACSQAIWSSVNGWGDAMKSI